jgi:ubiquinone/menaquinone biosynthesis C-methylase UbiE
MLREFIEYLSGLYMRKEKSPAVAYDLWASAYDDQPGNLMIDLDEEIFSSFLQNIELKGKIIADIGCGTGRHWKKILDKAPHQLIGYDVSVEMLKRLKEKYPEATTHLLTDNLLHGLENNSCDVLTSTLTVAHIENLESAFAEWDRVLKPGGEVVITDYHPELLAKGGKRTFKYRNKIIAIQNFIHPIEKVKALARQLHWNEIRFTEKKIDEAVKEYYENQYALSLYEKFKGTAVIYGIHFKKSG